MTGGTLTCLFGRVIELAQQNPRITVVNDNPEFLELMHELLEESSGYDVTTIDGDTITDIEPIRASRPELLIIDLRWRRDGLAGWDILMALRAEAELGELPIILCTGDLQTLDEHAEEIERDPKVRVLQKPCQVADLEGLVRGFLMKPFPPESFRANVEVIQGFRGPRMGQDAQEGAGFAESSHPAAVR